MPGHLLFVILICSFHESQVQALLPPKLVVNTAVITETDSVTLNCRAPKSVSVSQCFFYTGEQETTKGFSCMQRLTGSELLLMSHQSSPAEVEVRCFYTVKYEAGNSPSPHSDPISISIQRQKPQMNVQHFDGEQVVVVCSLPGSVKDNTRCNLYFGEASRPVQTTTVWKKSSSKQERLCMFYVPIDDFLRYLHFVQQKDASCDYSLESEPNSLSPRSDGYSMKGILEKESLRKSLKSASTTTTTTAELSLTTPGAFTSATSVTSPSDQTLQNAGNGAGPISQNPSSKISKWMWAVAVTCLGVTAGIIVLVLAVLKSKGTGTENLNVQGMKTEASDIYHVYATISEDPAVSASQDLT